MVFQNVSRRKPTALEIGYRPAKSFYPHSPLIVILRLLNSMQKVGFYPAGTHKFQTHEQTSSKYWAVRSENLMFTYFEVAPHKAFESHSHESEQMTYVLQGRLFFKIDEHVYVVGQGDLISIPSFKEHAVWTEADGATAVDAWSPVNDIY
jgi:quercetin dioxygenase-like cupin family protein